MSPLPFLSVGVDADKGDPGRVRLSATVCATVCVGRVGGGKKDELRKRWAGRSNVRVLLSHDWSHRSRDCATWPFTSSVPLLGLMHFLQIRRVSSWSFLFVFLLLPPF